MSRGGFASAYMPSDYTKWKDEAKDIAASLEELPAPELLGRPVEVDMVVRVTKPRTSKLPFPSPDVDNYAKGVLDALTQSEVWWTDDKQVVALRARKRWATEEEDSGVEVTIQYL